MALLTLQMLELHSRKRLHSESEAQVKRESYDPRFQTLKLQKTSSRNLGVSFGRLQGKRLQKLR